MATKFEVGRTYQTRSACDYDCIFSFTIVRRTEKSVWVEYHGEVTRRKINHYDGVETCYPLGTYSMAPCISADDTDEEKPGISHIEIHSESNVVPSEGMQVATVEAADDVLKSIAINKNPGGYDKTFFKIVLMDGNVYSGRIDVHYINQRQETLSGKLGILEHIRTRKNYFESDDCPPYVTEEHRSEFFSWCEALGV